MTHSPLKVLLAVTVTTLPLVASELHVADRAGSGLSHFTYLGPPNATYVAGGFFAPIDPNQYAIVVDRTGYTHVAHSQGVSAFHYDLNTDTYTTVDFFPLPGARALAVTDTEVIHVGHSAGLSALRFDHGRYGDTGAYFHFPTPVTALALDGAGVIHVGHGQGVSALTFDEALHQYQDTGAFIPIPGVRDLLIDAQGGLHVPHENGLAFLQFTGSSYDGPPSGFFPLGGPGTAAVADAQGVIHVTHINGISALAFDYETLSYVDTQAFTAIVGATDIAIDADEVIHVGHAAGVSGLVYVPQEDPNTDFYADAGFVAVPEVTALTVPGAYCGDATHPIPAGDLTGDCLVDLFDLAELAAGWPGTYDMADLQDVATNWLLDARP